MFDEMISKKLIEWIWILASIGVVINGIVLMIAGRGGLSFLLALIFMAIGLLVVRVFCESMIVIFKINDNLEQSTAALMEIRRQQPELLTKLASRPVAPVVTPNSTLITGTVPKPPMSPERDAQIPVTTENYDNAMSVARQQLQEEVRPRQSPSKSRLAEWPGSSTGSTHQ